MEKRIRENSEYRQILNSVGPVDPYMNHDRNLSLRHPATGLWFIESDEFAKWLAMPNSRLWLYGIPGAGKTTLFSSIVQESLSRRHHSVTVASFYCDYNDIATQDPSKILGSLVKQIAKQSEQSFKKLQEFHQKYDLENKSSITYDPNGLRDLIIAMSADYDNLLVMIDGLDECGQNTRKVVELLASLHTNGDEGKINTLVLSRDELEIRDILGGYSQVSIAATSGDLKSYVRAEIESRTRDKILRIRDPSLKENIIEHLAEGADGM